MKAFPLHAIWAQNDFLISSESFKLKLLAVPARNASDSYIFISPSFLVIADERMTNQPIQLGDPLQLSVHTSLQPWTTRKVASDLAIAQSSAELVKKIFLSTLNFLGYRFGRNKRKLQFTL